MQKKFQLEYYTRTGTSEPIDSQEDLNHALFEETGVEMEAQDQSFYMSDDSIIFVNSFDDEINFPEEDTMIAEAVGIVSAEIEAEELEKDTKEHYSVLHTRLQDGFQVIGILNGTRYALKAMDDSLRPNLEISKPFQTLGLLREHVIEQSSMVEENKNLQIFDEQLNEQYEKYKRENEQSYHILHYRTPRQYIYAGLVLCTDDELKEVERQVGKINELLNNPDKVMKISKHFESMKHVVNYLKNMGLPAEDIEKLQTDPLYVAALIDKDI